MESRSGAGDLEVEPRPGYLEARYLGLYSLPSYLDRMTRSVQACLDLRLGRLLVDIRGLTRYSPSTTDRFEIGNHGARISGRLRIAVLATADQLRDTFASLVAQNRGVDIIAFTEREKAVEWLLAPPA